MVFYPNEKLGVFIDGANFYSAARGLDLELDYKRFLTWLRKRGQLVRAVYYTALVEGEDRFSPIRPLVDFLDYNGYTIVTKPAKTFTDRDGQRRIKGDMDVDIAVDALEAANYLDHLVLCSGDGDFRALVEALQRKGVRVSVISSLKSDPPMISDDLRRQADAFIDLADLADAIGREVVDAHDDDV